MEDILPNTHNGLWWIFGSLFAILGGLIKIWLKSFNHRWIVKSDMIDDHEVRISVGEEKQKQTDEKVDHNQERIDYIERDRAASKKK